MSGEHRAYGTKHTGEEHREPTVTMLSADAEDQARRKRRKGQGGGGARW